MEWLDQPRHLKCKCFHLLCTKSHETLQGEGPDLFHVFYFFMLLIIGSACLAGWIYNSVLRPLDEHCPLCLVVSLMPSMVPWNLLGPEELFVEWLKKVLMLLQNITERIWEGWGIFKKAFETHCWNHLYMGHVSPCGMWEVEVGYMEVIAYIKKKNIYNLTTVVCPSWNIQHTNQFAQIPLVAWPCLISSCTFFCWLL